MKRQEVRKKIYSKIDELPTLPVVVPRLLSLMGSEQSRSADISGVISSDLSLTSKILKVANSAYYGFSRQISDLERAVALLGFNMVRSLALSMGVLCALPSNRKKPHFSTEGLWIHSLAVATAIKRLNEQFGNRDNGDYLFVTGLLHDIGKVVLDQFFSRLFEQALDEAHNLEKARLYMSERRLIGFDHGEVGAMLLTRWKFPDIIGNPIAVHHQREIPEGTNPRDAAMLRIADALPQKIGMGEPGNPAVPEIHHSDLEILQIKEGDLNETKACLYDSKDEIYAFYGAIK